MLCLKTIANKMLYRILGHNSYWTLISIHSPYCESEFDYKKNLE